MKLEIELVENKNGGEKGRLEIGGRPRIYVQNSVSLTCRRELEKPQLRSRLQGVNVVL